MPENQEYRRTRETLNLKWGESAVALGLISDEAQERATQINQRAESNRKRVFEVQARFLCLRRHAIKDGDLPAIATVHDDMQWIELAQTHGITPDKLNECRDEIASGIGVAADVPASGEIAASLNFISGQDKNALLAAQAGERALRATERLQAAPQPITKEHFAQVLEAPKWSHIGAASDPGYLKTAQEANFKAEVLEALVSLAPDLLRDGEKSLLIKHALSSLQTLSTISYGNATNVLAGNGHMEAARVLRDVATGVAQAMHIENPYGFEHTATHMRVVDEGLTAAVDYLTQASKLEPEMQQKLTAALEGKSFTSNRGGQRGIV